MQMIRFGLMASVLTAASPAWPLDLLGSTLTFTRAYPTATTPYWANPMQTTTVASGTSDLIDWYEGPGATGFHLTVNPEATLIRFSFLSTTTFVGSASQFDGFVVTGFDADIGAVRVEPNFTRLNIFQSFNGPRELRLNLVGANTINSFGLTVSLVPEPAAATTLLAGLCWVALLVRRRRKRIGPA